MGDITMPIFGKCNMPDKAKLDKIDNIFWRNISWTLIEYEFPDGN